MASKFDIFPKFAHVSYFPRSSLVMCHLLLISVGPCIACDFNAYNSNLVSSVNVDSRDGSFATFVAAWNLLFSIIIEREKKKKKKR